MVCHPGANGGSPGCPGRGRPHRHRSAHRRALRMLFHFDGDRLTEEIVYFDRATLLDQIGVGG